MDYTTNFLDDLGPFLLYASIVLTVVVVMLGLSFFLGQRINRKYKNTPFESGIISVGSAQFRISVHFYLTAILFIIFDLEVVFLFAWAVSIREAGWLGFIEISVFIFILVIALIYLWRIGTRLEDLSSKKRASSYQGPRGRRKSEGI